MSNEPVITINGRLLTIGEAMTVRVALASFWDELYAHGLGDDEHGKRMAKAYIDALESIYAEINRDGI